MKKTNQSTKKEPAKSSSIKASSKKPSTIKEKGTSEPSSPKATATVKIPTIVSIEVKVKNNQIEYYIDGVYKRDGEIQIRKKGKLKFVSNDGALALNINPGLDKFSIQSADIGKLISLDATPKGPSGAPGSVQEFKYSVAVFTGNAVICNDPSLKVFN